LEGFAGGPAERSPHRFGVPRPVQSGGGVVVVVVATRQRWVGRGRRTPPAGTRRPSAGSPGVRWCRGGPDCDRLHHRRRRSEQL